MIRALAFHAERLHEDQVWKRLQGVLRLMRLRRIRATFFIYPFRAAVVAKDIGERVRFLAEEGHEIGQHTHFYAGTKIDKPDKVNDFSEANVVHCLWRDFEILCSTGVQPKGFTAGSWKINETILNTLIDLGFTYDCSSRFPKPKGIEQPHYYYHWLVSSQFYTNVKGGLLRLPTTCSLGEWFKWGRNVRTQGILPYQLIYLHDYDLLSFRNYLLLWGVLLITKENSFVPADVLAQQLLNF